MKMEEGEGTAIPSKGYRAVGGPAVERAAVGDLMSQSGATYNKLTDVSGMTGAEAKSVLRPNYEPSRVTKFDTPPLADDLKVPDGKWNTSPIPEPVKSTFPEFVEGGAIQVKTTTPIQNLSLKPFSN